MKRYLIDTNILSETSRLQPNIGVMRWFDTTPAAYRFISVITLAEIYKGIERAEDKQKKYAIEQWLGRILLGYSGRVIAIGEIEAKCFGELMGSMKTYFPHLDGLIAASALVHNLVVVTRNIKDFDNIPSIKLHNPWK